MKSSLIYIPAAQFISFTLFLIFSGKIKTQFLAIFLEGIHLKRARGVRKARHPHMVNLARFWTFFFQLPNWGNIFLLFVSRGWVGWFVCFLRSREFRSLFQFGRAGAVSKRHAQEYKRALHLWSCILVFPSIPVGCNLKEAIELKGGTNNLQADKARESWERPNFHGTLVFQFIFKCSPKQLDNLSVATAERCSQGEIASNLLRADERCVCVSVLLMLENKRWTQDVGQSLSAAEQIPRAGDWQNFLWSRPGYADLQQPKIYTNMVVSVTNFDALLLFFFFFWGKLLFLANSSRQQLLYGITI